VRIDFDHLKKRNQTHYIFDMCHFAREAYLLHHSQYRVAGGGKYDSQLGSQESTSIHFMRRTQWKGEKS